MIVDSDFYAILLRYELHESMENQIEVLKPRTDLKRNLCEVFVALYVIIFLAKGAFGVIKQDRDFRRFFVRSKDKTETQFFLLAFAFNIKKLWNRTLDKRLGMDLFKKEAA